MAEEVSKSETAVSTNQSHKRLRDLNWQDLKIFGAVARAGSLKGAASLLRVQMPTISKRIESLESDLGKKLFDRTSRGLALTRQGRHVADGAEAMEMIVQDTHARLSTSRDMDGEVRLLMSDGPANRWFMPYFYGQFVRRFPRVSLRLGTLSEAEGQPPPNYDVYLAYAPSSQSGYTTVRLAKMHPLFLATRGYLQKYGTPDTVADLANHRFAEMTPSHTAQRGFISAYADLDTYGRASLVSNSGLSITSAVESGTMIGFLPSYIYLTSDAFVSVLPSIHSENGIFLNFPPSAVERAEVRGLIDFLKLVVFNKHRMPWFADEYVPPTPEWRTDFERILKEPVHVE